MISNVVLVNIAGVVLLGGLRGCPVGRFEGEADDSHRNTTQERTMTAGIVMESSSVTLVMEVNW